MMFHQHSLDADLLVQKLKFTTYSKLIKDLRRYLKSVPNLQEKNNTVIKQLSGYAKCELASLIIEHSHFTDRSIHYLLEGCVRTHDWWEFQKELRSNIDEELGSKTGNIPHLEIKRKAYVHELYLDMPRYLQPGTATRTFLKKLDDTFTMSCVPYLAGAFCAFEGTAISEFKIMSRVIDQYLKVAQYTRMMDLPCTNLYINGHKRFEVAHEQDLIDSAAKYVTKDNFVNFASGYLRVCLIMSEWWENLAINLAQGKLS